MIKGFSVTQVLSSFGILVAQNTTTIESATGAALDMTLNCGPGGVSNNNVLVRIRTNNTVRGFFGYSTSQGGGFGIFNSSGAPLLRFSTNLVEQLNSTNAQTSRIYGTYTDGSNYRRVAIAMTTAGVASIAPEGAGTGASGNVLHISGLPTSNPGPGILWNDGGTVKVGT